jgi:hypothetical protein
MASGFSLNYAFVLMMVTLGIFAALIAAMPGELIAKQPEYTGPTTQNKEVVAAFSAYDITVYKYTWVFNITTNTMQSQPLNYSGTNFIEFHWDKMYTSMFFEHEPIGITVRHAYQDYFLWIIPTGLGYHFLDLTDPSKSNAQLTPFPDVGLLKYFLRKENLLALQQGNGSYFEVACEHFKANFLVSSTSNSSSLAQSWDAGQLHVLSSYEIDFDAMKPSAWQLMAQLVTFKKPDLGIPGDAGSLLSYMLGIGFWITIALLIYTLVTRILPWIRGGLED